MSEVIKAKGGQYLSFVLSGQTYAVPIFSVIEINQMSEITPLPETPSYVKGVLNLRGRIIPIIDLRLKFALNAKDYDKETCIIVVETSNGLVGVIVDAVREVVQFQDAQIEMAPQVNGSPEQSYISGIGKQDKLVTVLLEIDRVFAGEEFGQVAPAAA